MTDGEYGIIINGYTDTQWAFVLNERMGINIHLEEVITGLKDVESPTPTIRDYYNLNGCLLPSKMRGLNIIRFKDGTSKKVLVK